MQPSDRPEDRETLQRAAGLQAPLRRAADVARSNGTGYAVFGVLTLLTSLLFSPLPPPLADVPALVVGAVLLGVGLAARRLAQRLRQGEAAAARALARNEALLLLAIAAYCVLSMTVLDPVDALDAQIAAAGLENPYAGLGASISQIVYATMLCVTLAYQGGLALYFHRRAAAAQAYRDEVPDWARQAVESLGD